MPSPSSSLKKAADSIRQLVATGDSQGAIELLIKLTRNGPNDFAHAALTLSGQLAELEKQSRTGQLPPADVASKRTQIAFAILKVLAAFIQKMRSETTGEQNGQPSNHSSEEDPIPKGGASASKILGCSIAIIFPAVILAIGIIYYVAWHLPAQQVADRCRRDYPAVIQEVEVAINQRQFDKAKWTLECVPEDVRGVEHTLLTEWVAACIAKPASAPIPVLADAASVALHGHSKVVNSVSFHPDKPWIASSGGEGDESRVLVQDYVKSGVKTDKVYSVEVPNTAVMAVRFSPNGKRLAFTGSLEQNSYSVREVSAEDGKGLERTVESAGSKPLGLAYNRDGSLLAVAYGPKRMTVEVFKTERLAYSPDSMVTRLSALWPPNNNPNDIPPVLQTLHTSPVFGNKTDVLAVQMYQVAQGSIGDKRDLVHEYSISDKPSRFARLVEEFPTEATSLSFSEDDSRLAVLLVPDGSDPLKNKIGLWDPASLSMKWVVPHTHAVAVRYTPDGRRIISCGTDGSLKILEPREGKCLYETKWDGDGEPRDLAVSKDGKRIAWAASGVVRVWGQQPKY